ncbi:major facilitator superfamily MFS_1 [Hyphomicrobium denitrificans ATCC 51888]|uniref:Major facilitator superfamily MFS_1 n=1 Tax=Hyphomicrobium denitrificans (strain ATCC 51888 / DSM 1869 / NCIMB 11706 / TK 0415) TaxID=582899 RepID=D8JV56_HYPDA|nr:OFA family MFS transporter [Hyphomicrobium denitrificans]ADJ22872.1 major facilitator superfamily MFS_1 [Hyphomicrobium denitrificans ATCC 51888]
MTAMASDQAPGLLDRGRIVARAGFNRWLVPPAALAIHLCIGMSYGLSVFWLPLSQALGISKPVACPDMSLMQELFTTTCDWRVSSLLVTFELGIVFLGLSAAAFGGWLERAGPRRAGVSAALCWGGGFLLAALAVYIHQLWLFWLGLGVIGGIGLGLGYISPVSTLIKWFPDRRGMATGMAIMGFGGGAMIGSPLAILLMNHFKDDQSSGVAQAMAVMGCIYLVFMLCGAFGYRVPPDGWKPDGWTQSKERTHALITTGHVHLNDAHKTPQFWLIWVALWMNVSAGIGVLSMASPMLQEIFGGSLIGRPDLKFGDLDASQHAVIAGIAGGFVSLLSLFNSGGRFAWASLSDILGRKVTYFSFFILGMILYVLAPTLAHMGSVALFVGTLCIIISMYGGGFATLPAYLADIFGTQFVGAIHGRILTAWSAAGILGPLVIGYIRDAEIAAGVPRAAVYDYTLYILTGFLLIGLIANALVRPVDHKYMMTDEQLAALKTKASTATLPDGSHGIGFGGFSPAVLLAWLAVGIPFLWGVWNTLVKAVALFG